MPIVNRRLLLSLLFIAPLLMTGCSTAERAHFYSGTIEGTEILIQSELGGVIKSMALEEGNTVEQGQTTAELAAEEHSLRVAEAQAAVEAAEATLQEAQVGSRQENIREGAAKVEQAQALRDQAAAKTRATKAQLDILEANKQQLSNKLVGFQQTLSYQQDRLHKAEVLGQAGALAEQEIKALREAVNQAQTAVSDLEQQLNILDAQIAQANEELASSSATQASAEANTKAARANLEALQAGHTNFTLRNLSAQKEMASSRLEQAQLQLSKTRIRSPEAGTIIRKHVHNGEIIKPGAVLYTLLKKGDLEVVVYVPVTELNQVKLGQTAHVFVDAYPERSFTGKVTHIANEAEFTPKNVQIPDERAKMVFAVTIALDAGQEELKPGMPADISFTPAKEGGSHE